MSNLFGETWKFAHLWNESLLDREEREVKPRDYLWASELGKSYIDIYLKMKGEVMTNPPNPRSLRKFEAGNIWEWLVGLILKRAGLFVGEQEYLRFAIEPGLLEVSGKADFIAGGVADFKAHKESLKDLDLPEVFLRATKNIIESLEKESNGELEKKILEIKSVSSFMFDSIENSNKSSKIHRLQLYHYLASSGIERGNVVYICKDDCRMIEIPVNLNDKAVKEEYTSFIKGMTYYIKNDIQPPLEDLIVWDKDFGKFSTNFNVSYSGYLTKLYGFSDQMEYEDQFRPITESWNRVIGRIKSNKPMTKNNEEKLKEMEEQGFKLDIIPEVVRDEETGEEVVFNRVEVIRE